MEKHQCLSCSFSPDVVGIYLRRDVALKLPLHHCIDVTVQWVDKEDGGRIRRRILSRRERQATCGLLGGDNVGVNHHVSDPPENRSCSVDASQMEV